MTIGSPHGWQPVSRRQLLWLFVVAVATTALAYALGRHIYPLLGVPLVHSGGLGVLAPFIAGWVLGVMLLLSMPPLRRRDGLLLSLSLPLGIAIGVALIFLLRWLLHS